MLVSGAHATLMQHITPEIIERVNRFFGYGAISQVRFRQGSIDAPSDREKRPALPLSLKPAPIELGESLRDIGDPELNRVLESLASAVASKESDAASRTDIGIKVVGKIGGSEKPAVRKQKDEI